MWCCYFPLLYHIIITLISIISIITIIISSSSSSIIIITATITIINNNKTSSSQLQNPRFLHTNGAGSDGRRYAGEHGQRAEVEQTAYFDAVLGWGGGGSFFFFFFFFFFFYLFHYPGFPIFFPILLPPPPPPISFFFFLLLFFVVCLEFHICNIHRNFLRLPPPPQIEGFSASGMAISFLRIQEKSSYSSSKFVKYVTTAGSYEHRI